MNTKQSQHPSKRGHGGKPVLGLEAESAAISLLFLPHGEQGIAENSNPEPQQKPLSTIGLGEVVNNSAAF